MRVPEPLFVVVNPAMRLLLRSPLHGLVSGSLMLITFTGRRSGRRYTTPVRYLRDGDLVYCLTSTQTRWWRNLLGDAEVTLRIRGRDHRCHAVAIPDDPVRSRATLERFLRCYPQDAAYHEVRLDAQHRPEPGDLERAARRTVVVQARAL